MQKRATFGVTNATVLHSLNVNNAFLFHIHPSQLLGESSMRCKRFT
jgi:hypothetical protein